MDTFKTCTMCKKELPATKEYFYKQKKGKYGLQSQCKKCMSERSKKYYNSHKELYQNFHNQYDKKYKQSIRGILNTLNSNSRRRFKENYISDVDIEQFIAMMKFFNGCCCYTGEPLTASSFSFDHVITCKLNGIHHISNVVPCLISVNKNKGPKSFVSWYINSEYFSMERLAKILAWQEFALNAWPY